jgi:hypothetical protein
LSSWSPVDGIYLAAQRKQFSGSGRAIAGPDGMMSVGSLT